MTGTSYRVPIKPMVPGGKADDENFRILESMPVRAIITNPANGAKLPAGTARVALRGAAWDGDLKVARGRRLDRLRRDLERGEAGSAAQPLRLGALGREPAAALRRLLTSSGCGPLTIKRQDAAPHRGNWNPQGYGGNADAPHRGAGGVRSRMRGALAIVAGLGLAAPATGQFTPGDETPEDFPPAPAATKHSSLHRLP